MRRGQKNDVRRSIPGASFAINSKSLEPQRRRAKRSQRKSGQRRFSVVAEREIYRDLGFDLDRLALQQIRMVLPLFNCVHRSQNQHRVAR
jgi:hypothetical protein